MGNTMKAMATSWPKRIFRKRHGQGKTEENVFSIQPKIVWECDVDGTWTAYPADRQKGIEESYQRNTEMAILSSLYGKSYVINFNATPFKQRNTNTGYEREVRRRVDDRLALAFYRPPPVVWETVPSTWIEHENGEDLMMVKVSQGSAEWKMVEKKLKSSLKKAKLYELSRVQNLHLWEYYMFRKKRISKLSDTGPNVTRVWHGSRSVDPMTICLDRADGFKTQCSRSGGRWGTGTYFAKRASYSDADYSYKPRSNLKSLILCDLIVGDSIKLSDDSPLRHPPEKPGNALYLNRRYDTVTVSTEGGKIFVVYENGRAYPHYIVTYRTE